MYADTLCAACSIDINPYVFYFEPLVLFGTRGGVSLRSRRALGLHAALRGGATHVNLFETHGASTGEGRRDCLQF